MQSLRPRQGAYFTLLWTSNGGRESQPLNLSPTRNFKRKVFIWKTCEISSHAALHFVNVLILSEISKTICSIGWWYLSFYRNINKYILKSLDDLIDSRFTIDQSKGILNCSKNWWNSPRSFWMARSILDSCLIDRKEHLINWREFSIIRKIKEIHPEVSRWLNQLSIPVQ